jgi:3-oxoacyl-[acyl-carrier-protein] synthase III
MIYLHGMGHFHPDNVITNRFISDLDIGSDETWIMERVGIASRHTTLALDYIRETRNSDPRAAREASMVSRQDMGVKAATLAMERAGVTVEDIGMVISGTSTPEHTIPAEATCIAAGLGVEATCFDLNSACSTFLVQLSVLDTMAPHKTPPYILIVHPENYTHVVDYSDRTTAPLFGDGASAAVVSLTEPSNKVFSHLSCQSNPSAWDTVRIPRMGHFTQQGQSVQGFAIRTATQCLKRLQQSDPQPASPLTFIGHQANALMLSHVCERCHIPPERHWHNVVDHGNTGGSSAPSVLSQNWSRLTQGDRVAMVVVGSGLTWGEALLTITDKHSKESCIQ